jgi:hypothetical protein
VGVGKVGDGAGEGLVYYFLSQRCLSVVPFVFWCPCLNDLRKSILGGHEWWLRPTCNPRYLGGRERTMSKKLVRSYLKEQAGCDGYL